MAGRNGGPVREFLSMMVTLFMVAVCVIVLVSSGGWRTISSTFGVGDPDAGVGDITAVKPQSGQSGQSGQQQSPPQQGAGQQQPQPQQKQDRNQPQADPAYSTALTQLDDIPVRKARQGGYDRERQFGGWASNGCGKATTRDTILARDLTGVSKDTACRVTHGVLHDPYTGRDITFTRGRDTSAAVQIDHVVALQDAWASGARDWPQNRRVEYANSPDVLLASDGKANMAKGAGLDFNGTSRYLTQHSGAPDIWMPDNQSYRCDYMAKRVAIKHQWNLSMTPREKQQTTRFIGMCAAQGKE